jgi:hypothetical protein
VSGYSHVCAAFSTFGIVCNSAAVEWCTIFVKILSCMGCLILAGKIFELQYRMGCVDGGCALWDAFTQVNKFVVSPNQMHILDFSVYLCSTRILVVANTKSNAPSIFISPG